MKYTQHQLILIWTLKYKAILPAKMGGEVFKGTMFGSETTKRCRELRAFGWLEGYREGRFVAFSLTKKGQEVAKKIK